MKTLSGAILSAAGLAAVLLLSGGCDDAAEARRGGPPPLTVQTVVAEAHEMPRTLSAVGELESPEMTTLATEIAGTVVAIAVPEGKRVEAGHLLLRLDDAEARAAVRVTQARLGNAKDRQARIELLFEGGVASQQQQDDVRSTLEAAEGAHQEATTRLAKHVLRTPYTGRLGLRKVDLGDYLRPGDPVVEISQTNALELRFALPQRNIAEIAVGQTVLGIVGRCGPRFEGTLVAVDPRVDPRTRMVGIRAAVANESHLLHPGMAVRVRLVVEMLPDAIVIPQEGVVRQGTRHLVFIVEDGGTVQPQDIRLGEYFVDGVHVTSGLEAGATVVVAGQQKLRSGSTVKTVPFTPTKNPNVGVGRYGPLGCDEL